MTTLTLEKEPQAVRVETDETHLTVYLADGRTLLVPLGWYPRLEYAMPKERANYELWDDGAVIAWPELDEHVGVSALVAGRRSREGKGRFERWMKKLDERRKSPNPGPWVKPKPLPDWFEEKAP